LILYLFLKPLGEGFVVRKARQPIQQLLGSEARTYRVLKLLKCGVDRIGLRRHAAF